MSVVNENSSTFQQTPAASPPVVVSCEHSMSISTGAYRAALAFNLMSDVIQLKKMFSEVIVSNVRVEIRQSALLGQDSGNLMALGRVFAAIIPSGKNTDSSSGTNSATVMAVRRKQAFPLSSVTQENQVLSFDLTGFEVDVAQDPRRQQGLVAWLGNTGVKAALKEQTFEICSATWYFDCTCSGVAASW